MVKDIIYNDTRKAFLKKIVIGTVSLMSSYFFAAMSPARYKGYFRHKIIRSDNVTFEAEFDKFFILWKSHVQFFRCSIFLYLKPFHQIANLCGHGKY